MSITPESVHYNVMSTLSSYVPSMDKVKSSGNTIVTTVKTFAEKHLTKQSAMNAWTSVSTNPTIRTWAPRAATAIISIALITLCVKGIRKMKRLSSMADRLNPSAAETQKVTQGTKERGSADLIKELTNGNEEAYDSLFEK